MRHFSRGFLQFIANRVHDPARLRRLRSLAPLLHPAEHLRNTEQEQIMKNYEDKVSSDTVLGAGLIAITIAWVVLAAVRGPIGADASDNAVRYAPAALSVQAPASAGNRTMALPANVQHGVGEKIS
jgi:hypothetical protein